MKPGEIVEAPDGQRWRVRRRWLDRPAPKLRKGFKRNAAEGAGEGLLEGFSFTNVLGDFWWGMAVVVVLFVLVLVVLPLLGVALEIIAVLFLLLWGVIGRVALGKPWSVEAVPVGGEVEDRAVYAVKGWRLSKEAARELATTIKATGAPPQRLARGKRLATRPAGSGDAGAPAPD